MLHRPGPNVALLLTSASVAAINANAKYEMRKRKASKYFEKKNKKTSSLQLPHSLTTLFRLCWDVDKSGISDRESSALLAA